MENSVEWTEHEAVLIPQKLRENLRADCDSDEEYQKRLDEIRNSDAAKFGGFAKMKIKYRVRPTEENDG